MNYRAALPLPISSILNIPSVLSMLRIFKAPSVCLGLISYFNQSPYVNDFGVCNQSTFGSTILYPLATFAGYQSANHLVNAPMRAGVTVLIAPLSTKMGVLINA